jgi:CRP/FNR family transcriptional regulator, cyclic AMP receptor protein
MSVEGVTATIHRCEIFAQLSDDECAALARQCGFRKFARHDQVFAQGDAGTTVYIVAQGSVALSVTTEDGGTLVMAVLRPPQSFGEMAVIDGVPRVATATAREATVLVTIPAPVFLAAIASHPSVAMNLLKALSRLVRRVDDFAIDLVLIDVSSRVAKFLLAAVAGPTPVDEEGFQAVDLRMSQTELARLVGGSRQSVNKALMSLEGSGAVRRRGSRVVAVHAGRLHAALA